MTRVKLKCGGRRKKCFLGESVAAAGIQAAATLASAGMQAAATKKSAEQQAAAIKAQASQQSRAMETLNENNNQLQEQMINFQSAQNEMERETTKGIQETLAMQMGQQNTDMRNEEAKKVLMAGGKRKRKSMKHPSTGVADGNVIAEAVANGTLKYDGPAGKGQVYTIIGPSHKNGGVDIDLKNPNGKVLKNGKIEAEGGEKIYVDNNQAIINSRHNLPLPNGGNFNPAAAVDAGMNPVVADNIAQASKDYFGYDDSGNPKAKCGAHRKLKCGGRKKAWDGFKNWWNGIGSSGRANVYGSGITGAANLIGGGINLYANKKATGILNDAYSKAGQVLAAGYDNLRGIDTSLINKKDFEASHAFVNLADPRVNTRTQVSQIERSRDRLRNDASQAGSMASRMARMNTIEANTVDKEMQVADAANKQSAEIQRSNQQAANQAAQFNAAADTQGRQAYMNSLLNAEMYNAGVHNQQVLGKANAEANVISGQAQVNANYEQNKGGIIGQMINGTLGNAATTFTAVTNRREELNDRADAMQPEQQIAFWLNRGELTKAYNIWKGLTDEKLRSRWKPEDFGVKAKCGKRISLKRC